MKSPSNNQLGFTLLEVIIAIALLSFLMTGVYTIFDSSVRTKDQASLDDKEVLGIEETFSRIERDLSTYYSPVFFSKVKKESDSETSETDVRNEKFTGKTTSGDLIPKTDSPDNSTLLFMSFGNQRRVANSKQSNYVWIKYALRGSTGDAETRYAPNEIVRYAYATNIYSSSHSWETLTPQILQRNVKDFEISYYDGETKRFVTAIASLKDQNRLKLFKVMIIWVDNQGVEQKTIRFIRPLYQHLKSLDLEHEKEAAPEKWDGEERESAPISTQSTQPEGDDT